MASAYSLTLTNESLVALLDALESSLGQAILESVADISFVGVARAPDDFHFNKDFDPLRWERGRAFGEQMELRWRRRREDFAVLIISDLQLALPSETESQISPLPEPYSLERVEGNSPFLVQLWGEWQNPVDETDLPDPSRHWWYEERVPRFLGYPWNDKNPYLAIEVARYVVADQFAGDYMYRFVGLRPMPVPAKGDARR